MLTVAALLAMIWAPAADTPMPSAPPEPLVVVSMPEPGQQTAGFWQMVIEQRLIIRVPAQRSPLNNFSAAPAPQARVRQLPVEWKEKKAPKCVAMRNIAGMQATEHDSIDLLTRQRQRLRAELSRGCRGLDFYAGFYMQGTKDGQLCEDRDEIHARTGAKCQIKKFRLMVPVVRDDD